jgi:hypothetical protein
MSYDNRRKISLFFCDFAERKPMTGSFVCFKKTIVFLSTIEYDNENKPGG